MNEPQKNIIGKIQEKLKTGEKMKLGWHNAETEEEVVTTIFKDEVAINNPETPYFDLLELGLLFNQEIFSFIEFDNKKGETTYVYEGENVIGECDPLYGIPDDFEKMSDQEQAKFNREQEGEQLTDNIKDDAYNNQDDFDKLLKMALEFSEN